MFSRILLFIFAFDSLSALAAPAVRQSGGHLITITNNCDQKITPYVKPSTGPAYSLNDLQGGGQQMTHTVEANWNSGRVWGMTPVCMDPADGQGCTLVECTLGSDGLNPGGTPNCNLSSASGWNAAVEMTVDSLTKTCNSPTDPECYWIDKVTCAALPTGACQANVPLQEAYTASVNIVFSNCE